MNLTSRQMLGTRVRAALDRSWLAFPPAHCADRSRSWPWREALPFSPLRYSPIYSQEKSIPKGCSHEDSLLHCWTKARPRRCRNRWYQMGAARGRLRYGEPAELIPWPRDVRSTARTWRPFWTCRTVQPRLVPAQVSWDVSH